MRVRITNTRLKVDGAVHEHGDVIDMDESVVKTLPPGTVEPFEEEDEARYATKTELEAEKERLQKAIERIDTKIAGIDRDTADAADAAARALAGRPGGPTLEEYVKAGYQAENYPPDGFAEVPSEGLTRYKTDHPKAASAPAAPAAGTVEGADGAKARNEAKPIGERSQGFVGEFGGKTASTTAAPADTKKSDAPKK